MNTNIYSMIVSSTSSMLIATEVDATPLLTALITIGVSFVTIVGADLVKLLHEWFKKKHKEISGDDDSEIH